MKNILAMALAMGLSLAFTGCDFVSGGDSVSLGVSAVRVNDLPIDDRGQPWDADSGPDLVLEIQNAAGHALYRSEAQQDVDLLAGPVTFAIPDVQIPSPSRSLFVTVYETDGNRFTDNQIRTSEAFYVADLDGVDVLELDDIQGRSFTAEVVVQAVD